MQLTHQQCAGLLCVSVRTVQNWESGVARVPYAAYKLMRVLRGGKHLGPEWRNFFIRGDVLITAEGHHFRSSDLAWWSLLVRQADAFREIMRKQRAADAQAAASPSPGTVAPVSPIAVATTAIDSAPAPALASAVSTSRNVVPQQEDPSPRLVDTSAGTAFRTISVRSGKDSKSLKVKGFLADSLSLTIQKRPAHGAPDKTPQKAKNGQQTGKAVRA